jgi:hypothetical protein
MLRVSLVACEALIVLVLLEVTLDFPEELLLDLGGHQGTTLRQHVVH